MKKPLILIIEDDSWMAEQYRQDLASLDIEYDYAADAAIAIQKIDSNRPTIILLDILLNGQTAFALLNEIRSHSDLYQIPIIVCSNLASDFNFKDLSSYGIKYVLDKTIMQPDDLLTTVSEVLDEC